MCVSFIYWTFLDCICCRNGKSSYLNFTRVKFIINLFIWNFNFTDTGSICSYSIIHSQFVFLLGNHSCLECLFINCLETPILKLTSRKHMLRMKTKSIIFYWYFFEVYSFFIFPIPQKYSLVNFNKLKKLMEIFVVPFKLSSFIDEI